MIKYVWQKVATSYERDSLKSLYFHVRRLVERCVYNKFHRDKVTSSRMEWNGKLRKKRLNALLAHSTSTNLDSSNTSLRNIVQAQQSDSQYVATL